MSFLHDPTVTLHGDGSYTLTNDVMYMGNSDEFLIPAGFATDLASVPRLFWWLVSPTETAAAAVLHDWLWAENRAGRGLDPVDVDGLFRHALRAHHGVGAGRRWLMWTAVRFVACVSGRVGRWGVLRAAGFLVWALLVGLVMVPPALVVLLWLVLVLGFDWLVGFGFRLRS